ncbi:MAG: hypothetical protein ASARMPREDX12_008311 [Alectoria sarmentosa]|nr:MAG: hypothetical protein ASARMPRED_004615 [Alectoria sarmentosa]CAD6577332.1 MAG: hypothetical protein ASARMPREDX12_008311 [Alectoria sarmentosa]
MSSPANHPFATPNDYGPLTNVLNWILVVISALAVLSRVAIKVNVSYYGGDDTLILIALAFSVALCITSTFQTANGLGQHEATLSAKQLQAYQKVFSSVLLHGLKLTRKATFATDITYTTTLITSKLSVIWFLHTLTLQRVHNHLRRALGLLVIAWGVSGLFAIAFQCPVPDTWQVLSQRCFHQVSFWNYLAVSNIVIELALITLPIAILRHVQMHPRRKVTIIACFAARIFVIGAIVAQLVFQNRGSGSEDRTFTAWSAAVCALFVQSLSIVTACVPYLKPLLVALQSGMIRPDDIRRREGSFSGAYDVTALGQTATTGPPSRSRTTKEQEEWRLEDFHQNASDRSQSVPSPIDMTLGHPGLSDRLDWDGESKASRSKMIRQEAA